MHDLVYGNAIYRNPLASEQNVKSWQLEGKAAVSFPQRRLRIESVIPKEEGQKANYVLWCPKDFPDHVSFSWDFYPVREPGLAMFWFAAKGRNGEEIFDSAHTKRTGEYQQYHHGDINAFHASYFRRGILNTMKVANLRKSYGFHLVAQGADPIPSFFYNPPYHIEVIKRGPEMQFMINSLIIWYFKDDGTTFGPSLSSGKIGFRQMAPLVAEYANLVVREVKV
ncbi:MAG: DUF1961 family protein [Candidatus Bathyarchaeota archaeon]|nr:MAG: DUF1961 family protein [Candidatus Bathyarchaeota archaeon]